jgi:hypothetical protein
MLASTTAIGVAYQQANGDPAPSRITIQVPDAYGFTPDAGGATPGTVIGFNEIQPDPPIGEIPSHRPDHDGSSNDLRGRG